MIKTILYSIIAITLSACAVQQQTTQASQPESTSSIKIPKNFYAEELGQCKMRGFKGSEITATSYRSEIDPIIGFDWQKHHTENSTSMTVEHRPLSKPLAYLSAASHHAAYSKDPEELKLITDYLFEIAKNNQFMNTISFEVASRTKCYGGNNNTSAPCPFHAPEHLGNNMALYLISAYWVKDYLTKDQTDVIDSYIKKIYFKYINTRAVQEDVGMYSMANGGIGRLAYAAWTNDKKMADKEFKYRFKQLDENWEDNGYIKGNSYRGVRGMFYHSMGVDIALGYIQLANAWGYQAPEKLITKVKKSAELINAYIDNPKNYYNYPDSKIPYNASKNPADAEGIHSQALELKYLMKTVVGVDLKYDAEFERGRIRTEFMDVMIGYHPQCVSQN